MPPTTGEWLKDREAANLPTVRQRAQQGDAQSTEVENRCPPRTRGPAMGWGVGQITQKDKWGRIHGGGGGRGGEPEVEKEPRVWLAWLRVVLRV